MSRSDKEDLLIGIPVLIVGALLIGFLIYAIVNDHKPCERSSYDLVEVYDCPVDDCSIFGSHDYARYFRDPVTDVMYVLIDGHKESALSVMLAADGSPLLYSEWLVFTDSE